MYFFSTGVRVKTVVSIKRGRGVDVSILFAPDDANDEET